MKQGNFENGQDNIHENSDEDRLVPRSIGLPTSPTLLPSTFLLFLLFFFEIRTIAFPTPTHVGALRTPPRLYPLPCFIGSSPPAFFFFWKLRERFSAFLTPPPRRLRRRCGGLSGRHYMSAILAARGPQILCTVLFKLACALSSAWLTFPTVHTSPSPLICSFTFNFWILPSPFNTSTLLLLHLSTSSLRTCEGLWQGCGRTCEVLFQTRSWFSQLTETLKSVSSFLK